MSIFKSHKPGQARLSRTITLLSGLFLIAWGSRSLTRTLPLAWQPLGDALNQQSLFGKATEAEAWRVNAVVFDEKLSPALIVSAIVLVAACMWWWLFLNRERWAETLIEMEGELRKVSWPTASDAWQSTLVVTGFTFVVVVTILAYDIVIKSFIELFVTG